MEENYLQVSNRELFYSAMMLGLERLVNVEYDFPADEAKLESELDETKRALHKKKLLKENTKGEITLDFALSLCAAFCSKPENCMVVDEGGFYATIYNAADSYMLLERTGEGEYAARWFADRAPLDGYITQKLGSGDEGASANGGT
ncbi:MAG: hypothetical protein LBQ36_03815 [Synergistaceae bacterium]|jgi:hypothetical protein|nr:hypothetical protein [Synergistaceae bacterium]